MIEDTIDNGESDVQVATIGKVVGSSIDGEPVEQNFTEESLKAIADNQTDEILVDSDHSSETGGDTSAKGWLSSLRFVEGKGLFGKIRWTDIGKKLIENRVFRWLSPSWILNDDTKEPIEMTSVALTNKPSQIGRIQPIVNSEPIENDFTKKETIIMEMTKEELIEFIKSTVCDIKAQNQTEEVKEVAESNAEAKTEEVKNECADCEAKVEQTEAVNKCKNEEPVEEKKEEVIKIETLNLAPNTSGIDISTKAEWESLNGADFIRYINSGKYKA